MPLTHFVTDTEWIYYHFIISFYIVELKKLMTFEKGNFSDHFQNYSRFLKTWTSSLSHWHRSERFYGRFKQLLSFWSWSVKICFELSKDWLKWLACLLVIGSISRVNLCKDLLLHSMYSIINIVSTVITQIATGKLWWKLIA